MLRVLLAVAVGVGVGVGLVCAHAADDPVVHTTNGLVRGTTTDHAHAFLGIPFAAAPVGSLRFKHPQPHPGWNDTLEAKTQPPGCMQHCTLPEVTCPKAVSEDCLLLNVYTPLGALEGDDARAVMVWIHGGAYRAGGVDTAVYDGQMFVERSGVVLFLVQYRMGAFGFLYGDGIDPNNGFHDQLFAMQWVKDNAQAFGGDPSQVTVFGESAGATSVSCMLVSPKATGLFHRAIIQSNPWSIPIRKPTDATHFTQAFASRVQCASASLECLQACTADQLLQAQVDVEVDIRQFLKNPLQMGMAWTPVSGLDDLPINPMQSIDDNVFSDVDVLLGTVDGEGVPFEFTISSSPVSWLEFDASMGLLFGYDNFKKLKHLYPPVSGDNRLVLARVITDGIFACPTRNVSRIIAARGARKVFLYHYNHVVSFGKEAWGTWTYCYDQPCHACELPLLFGAPPLYNFNETKAELKLSNQMIDLWTSFAKTGTPESSLLGFEWKPFTEEGDNGVLLATPCGEERGYRQHFCDKWDLVGYTFFDNKTEVALSGVRSALLPTVA